MRLEDVTDEDLLKAGLITIDEGKYEGPVVPGCFRAEWHSWSAPRYMPEDGWYQACCTCGEVKRAERPVCI